MITVNDNGEISSVGMQDGTTIRLPATGGNLILRAGIGGTWKPLREPVKREPDGSIIFQRSDGVESMRFDPSGEIYVRGELVDSNKEAYLEFKDWLNEIMVARIHNE